MEKERREAGEQMELEDQIPLPYFCWCPFLHDQSFEIKPKRAIHFTVSLEFKFHIKKIASERAFVESLIISI